MGIGSRTLNEEEGGVMEYTRRRHRALGGYEFQDYSYQFQPFGKWSVTIIYFAFWVFLMFPNWFLPIGRPGIALCGGLTMVVYRYILLQTGQGPVFYAEKVMFLEPLFLLFGLMLTTIYLEKMERGGLFDKLRNSLDDPLNWKRAWKIMAMSYIGSAAVMNDSVVLIFSGVVVDLCVRNKTTNSLPYLLSLATTANIGSALTMTGNPQNILIVTLAYDDISWMEFASNMVLPVLASIVINTGMMFIYYGKELFPGSTGFFENNAIIFTGSRTPEMLAQENEWFARMAALEPEDMEPENQGWTIWSKIQVFVTVLFLMFFMLGYDVCVVSITSGSTLTEVDYGLLMLFIGQFILIGSFDDTGVPQSFFFLTMGECADQMTSVPCVYWFVMIVTILSNLASNVPVVQMLAATFPYATPYDWMQVSFSATIAGNLTMLGSAANMIVAFQAAKVGDRTFTSERHAPFGIPSTIGCLYFGTVLLSYIHFSPDCSERLGTCNDGNANNYYQVNADEYYQADAYYEQ